MRRKKLGPYVFLSNDPFTINDEFFATLVTTWFPSSVAKWPRSGHIYLFFSPHYWYLKSIALFAKTDSNSSQEMSQAGESLEAMENFLTYQTLTNVGHCVLQTYGASPMNIQQRRSVAIWTGRPNQQIQIFTRTIPFVHWKVVMSKASIIWKLLGKDLICKYCYYLMWFQNAMMVLS